jgi:hypothetical protein
VVEKRKDCRGPVFHVAQPPICVHGK